MLTFFLLLNTVSLSTYDESQYVPTFNNSLYNLTLDNNTNLTQCYDYCDNRYNCSGFVLDDTSTCFGINDYNNVIYSNSSVFYRKNYCDQNCNSNDFLLDLYGNRCFCDNHCSTQNDCCEDYSNYCTPSPTTSPTTTPTSSPTSSPTTTPSTSPTTSPTTTSPTTSPTTTSPTTSPTTTSTSFNSMTTEPSHNDDEFIALYIVIGVVVGLILIISGYFFVNKGKNRSSVSPEIQMTDVNIYRNGEFRTESEISDDNSEDNSEDNTEQNNRTLQNGCYNDVISSSSFINEIYED